MKLESRLTFSWSGTMVLEVRKVITKLEECCPWYIFTAKQKEMPQISPQIEKSSSKMRNFRPKNLKKKYREILEGLIFIDRAHTSKSAH